MPCDNKKGKHVAPDETSDNSFCVTPDIYALKPSIHTLHFPINRSHFLHTMMTNVQMFYELWQFDEFHQQAYLNMSSAHFSVESTF